MDLKTVTAKLEKIYPLKLAEKWDNVGLLVEPSKPREIKKVFLTIDLSENVLEEALSQNVEMICSYHPPIFSAFKRLNTKNTKDRIILRAVEEKVAIYSPHSSVDAAKGGVTDWLAEGVGIGKVEVLTYHSDSSSLSKVSIHEGIEHLSLLKESLEKISGITWEVDLITSDTSSSRGRLETVCPKSKLAQIHEVVSNFQGKPVVEIYSLENAPDLHVGQGRLVTLNEKISIKELISRIKKHLGMTNVRLGLANGATQETLIQSVAMCAGSGWEVVSKTKADVYWSGEMRHHDVLEANAKGISCILCEHTNTERGYLPVMKQKLETAFEGKVEVIVSKVDADPLVVV